MAKLFFVLLMLIPLSGYSSIIYTYSEHATRYGYYGFSLTTPDYVEVDPTGWYNFGAHNLSSCDTSGNPLYVCSGGAFKMNASGALYVTIDLRDPKGSGFGATNSLTSTFLGASLVREGIYSAFDGGASGGGAVFSIQSDDATNAPEPSVAASIATGLGVLAVLGRVRKKRLVAMGN